MDPNANLAEIRAILQRPDGGDELLEDLLRLAELVGALDEWLTRGGAIPKAWRPF